MHDVNCRHGDLKPENILRFEDGEDWGTLVIADMGLAKVHREVTALRHNGTETLEGTRRYEPPEATLDIQRPMSRRADVWSFGCILLEFIIWLLYGFDELERFHGSFASFFSVVDGEVAIISPQVAKWIDHMKRDSRSHTGTAVRVILELVEERLLVVEQLTREEGILDTHLQGRVDARELHSQLQRIKESGEVDEMFIFDGSLWNQSHHLVGPRQGPLLSPGNVRERFVDLEVPKHRNVLALRSFTVVSWYEIMR
jgi:serine/threonine protein kinase